MGFLNPPLYHIGVSLDCNSNFHDITSGSNGKYTAVTGFDLVTGWGSFIGVTLAGVLAP